MESPSGLNLSGMPDEVLLQLCQSLDTRSLNRLAGTYSRFYNVCKSELEKRVISEAGPASTYQATLPNGIVSEITFSAPSSSYNFILGETTYFDGYLSQILYYPDPDRVLTFEEAKAVPQILPRKTIMPRKFHDWEYEDFEIDEDFTAYMIHKLYTKSDVQDIYTYLNRNGYILIQRGKYKFI